MTVNSLAVLSHQVGGSDKLEGETSRPVPPECSAFLHNSNFWMSSKPWEVHGQSQPVH